MTYATRVLMAATIALGSAFASAEEQAAAPASMLGHWSSDCDAWGVPATCTATWSVGKHQSHLVQDYAISRQADGVQIFAGRGLYRFDNAAVDGVWEDSRGVIQHLSGTYDNGQLKVIWGDAQTEIGRSIYTFDDNVLSVRDAVLTDQGWREFMSIDYAPPAG